MGYNNQPSEIVFKVDNMKQYGKDFSLRLSNSFNEFGGKIVTTIDSENDKLTVKGKLDPWEVRERVEKVTNKKVEFIFPVNPPKKKEVDGDTAAFVNPPKKKEADGGAAAFEPVKPKQENQLSTVILMADDMKRCEPCALMMENSVKELRGVDRAKYDRENSRLMVVGKVDKWAVQEHVEKITYNKEAEGGDKKKGTTAEPVEPKQLVVSTVMLKVSLDCDGCVRIVKKSLLEVKGVKEVTVDAENNLVTVKGTMDVNSLPSYLKKKLGRSVEIISESVETVLAKSAPAAAAAVAVVASATAAATPAAAATATATATSAAVAATTTSAAAAAAATATAAAAAAATATSAAAAATAAAAAAATTTSAAAAAATASAATAAATYDAQIKEFFLGV